MKTRTKKKIVRLGKPYMFEVFDIGKPKIPIGLHPRSFITGDGEEVERLYAPELAEFRGSLSGGPYVPVPYVFPKVRGQFFGDFASRGGGRQFEETGVLFSGEFRPPYEVRRLWEYAALKQNQRFGRHRDHCVCLRSLGQDSGGRFAISIGASMYEEAARTMGSEGVTIGLSKDDRARLKRELEPGEFLDLHCLTRDLERRFGKGVSVRRAIHSIYGRLPPFEKQVYCHMIGVAAAVVTSDERCVFVWRTPRTASVNYGVNVAVSGGVEYREEDIEKFGLPLFLIHELLREASEEIGVLGSNLSAVPIGFVRELPRGGSPEFLFLLKFYGGAHDLVESMQESRRAGQDADRFVFSLPLESARSLVREERAAEALQHKALITLIMLDRYLRLSA